MSRDAARAEAAAALAAAARALLEAAEEVVAGSRAAPSLLEGARRVRVSARLLGPLVDDVLDPARVPPGRHPDEGAALAARLRTYLRGAIDAVAAHAALLGDDPAAAALPTLAAPLARVREAAERAAALAEEAAARLESPPAAAPAGSVLVVDDSQVNRDLLHRMLGRLGHRVVLAEGGLHALALMRTNRFDLVLLDIIMPEVNGFMVLQQMKADRHLREVPVIMISALDETESVGRCIEMGAEDYLTKPFDPVILKARIGATLEKSRLRERAGVA